MSEQSHTPLMVIPICMLRRMDDEKRRVTTMCLTTGFHPIGTTRRDGLLGIITLHEDDIIRLRSFQKFSEDNNVTVKATKYAFKHFAFSWEDQTRFIEEDGNGYKLAKDTRINDATLEVNPYRILLSVNGNYDDDDWCEFTYALSANLLKRSIQPPDLMSEEEFEEKRKEYENY